MNDIITPVQNLIEEANTMQRFIEDTVGDDPTEWSKRGSVLCEFIARSGKCLADAKYHLDEKKKTFIINELSGLLNDFGYSATTQKELIASCCGDVSRLVTWFTRLNAACTHQVDWIRTLISKEKEEMKLNHVRQNIQNSNV